MVSNNRVLISFLANFKYLTHSICFICNNFITATLNRIVCSILETILHNFVDFLRHISNYKHTFQIPIFIFFISIQTISLIYEYLVWLRIFLPY